jgi:hypothetical protein
VKSRLRLGNLTVLGRKRQQICSMASALSLLYLFKTEGGIESTWT